MDISTIKYADREVELRHPGTEEGLGLFFQLRSPHDEAVKKVERASINERLARKKQNLTMESLEATKEKVILAAVSGWRWEGDNTIGGEQPDYSPQALRDMIRTHVWIREFLDSELGDHQAFLES